MDWAQISRLANILRDNGDKVLNEVCKLTLSTKLIQDLNQSFDLLSEQKDALNSSFSILTNTNLKVEIFRDIQFLHDFVQRTVSLKLVQCNSLPILNDNIEIKKFKNLKLLEFNKVKCSYVQGIQALRAQIQYLTCLRSISDISDILEKCGGDLSQGVVWNELKEAVFNHNNLEQIENGFQLCPWLQTLDLSHNNIQDIRPLNCLYNLKHLNLGYNKLMSIPTFSGQICNRLQILILCNNFIEDLSGLIVLVNLRELDLSDNCIMHHSALTPLANLATLQWLSMQGNPLCYHSEHRMLTSYNLHKNTSSIRFILDGQALSRQYIKYVGSLHPLKAKIPPLSTSASSSSVNTSAVERPRRTREAKISDNDDNSQDIENTLASISSLISSSDHLETRKQIEELREKYGSTWLYREGGSMVQDILGMPKSSYPKTSSPYESDFLLHAKEVIEARVTRIEPQVDKTNGPEKNSSNSVIIDKTDSANGTITKVSDQSLNDITEETLYDSAVEQISEDEDCPYPDENAEVQSTISGFDIEQGDDSMFLVTKRGEKNPIFFIVNDKIISERDTIVNAKEKHNWDAEILLSYQLIDDDIPYVQLEFDTLRSDKKLRQYVLDDYDDMQRLLGKLSKLIENRPPDKFICYKCMKCEATFGIEQCRDHDKQDLVCPSCLSSHVVIEE